MRTMSVICLAAVALVSAGSFRIDATMSDAGTRYSFEFQNPDSATRLWFDLPARCRFAVTTERDGQVADQRTVATSGPIDVAGPGLCKVTVAKDSGTGRWSCRHLGANEFVLQGVAGFAAPNAPCRFAFHTEADAEVWQFTYPTEATFYITRLEAGKVVEQQDLYDDTELQVIGPGLLTLEVAPADGEGEFTARLAK